MADLRMLPPEGKKELKITQKSGHSIVIRKVSIKDQKPGTMVPTRFRRDALAEGCGVVGIELEEPAASPAIVAASTAGADDDQSLESLIDDDDEEDAEANAALEAERQQLAKVEAEIKAKQEAERQAEEQQAAELEAQAAAAAAEQATAAEAKTADAAPAETDAAAPAEDAKSEPADDAGLDTAGMSTEQIVHMAILQVLAADDPALLDADGKPLQAAVQEKAGITVSKTALTRVWNRVSAELAEQ